MKKIVAVVCVVCVLSCIMCSAYADIQYGTPSILEAGAGGNNTYYIKVRMNKKSGYYSHVLCYISGRYSTNGMTTTYNASGSGANVSANKGAAVTCTARCYPQLPDDYRLGSYTVSCSGYWKN